MTSSWIHLIVQPACFHDNIISPQLKQTWFIFKVSDRKNWNKQVLVVRSVVYSNKYEYWFTETQSASVDYVITTLRDVTRAAGATYVSITCVHTSEQLQEAITRPSQLAHENQDFKLHRTKRGGKLQFLDDHKLWAEWKSAPGFTRKSSWTR